LKWEGLRKAQRGGRLLGIRILLLSLLGALIAGSVTVFALGAMQSNNIYNNFNGAASPSQWTNPINNITTSPANPFIVGAHDFNVNNQAPATATDSGTNEGVTPSTTASPAFTALDSSGFTYSNSCPGDTQEPYASGSTYYTPFPANVPSGCSYVFSDIVETGSQVETGFSFTGTFTTQGAAPAGSSDEEAIQAQDAVANWTGQGYGFRVSMSNDTVYGFVQDGTGKVNGTTYWYEIPLAVNNGTQNNYKVTVTSDGDVNTFDFYIDGVLKGTVSRTSVDYAAEDYHIGMDTHRFEDGWNSGDSQLDISNLTIISS
jgi:hypothetical protein